MLQEVIKEFPEEEARMHMKRCVDSGLWVPGGGGDAEENPPSEEEDKKESESPKQPEEGAGENQNPK